MRSETLRSSKFAVLAVLAIATTYVCVSRAPHRTNPEELRKAMGRVDRAPSAGASVAPAAAEAVVAGHCYSLHKPKLCQRETKGNSRTAPDGSACTNAVEDHVDEHVWEALPGWCDSSLPWPPGADPLGFLLRCAPATGSAAEALSRSGRQGQWEAAVRP